MNLHDLNASIESLKKALQTNLKNDPEYYGQINDIVKTLTDEFIDLHFANESSEFIRGALAGIHHSMAFVREYMDDSTLSSFIPLGFMLSFLADRIPNTNLITGRNK